MPQRGVRRLAPGQRPEFIDRGLDRKIIFAQAGKKDHMARDLTRLRRHEGYHQIGRVAHRDCQDRVGRYIEQRFVGRNRVDGDGHRAGVDELKQIGRGGTRPHQAVIELLEGKGPVLFDQGMKLHFIKTHIGQQGITVIEIALRSRMQGDGDGEAIANRHSSRGGEITGKVRAVKTGGEDLKGGCALIEDGKARLRGFAQEYLVKIKIQRGENRIRFKHARVRHDIGKRVGAEAVVGGQLDEMVAVNIVDRLGGRVGIGIVRIQRGHGRPFFPVGAEIVAIFAEKFNHPNTGGPAIGEKKELARAAVQRRNLGIIYRGADNLRRIELVEQGAIFFDVPGRFGRCGNEEIVAIADRGDAETRGIGLRQGYIRALDESGARRRHESIDIGIVIAGDVDRHSRANSRARHGISRASGHNALPNQGRGGLFIGVMVEFESSVGQGEVAGEDLAVRRGCDHINMIGAAGDAGRIQIFDIAPAGGVENLDEGATGARGGIEVFCFRTEGEGAHHVVETMPKGRVGFRTPGQGEGGVAADWIEGDGVVGLQDPDPVAVRLHHDGAGAVDILVSAHAFVNHMDFAVGQVIAQLEQASGGRRDVTVGTGQIPVAGIAENIERSAAGAENRSRHRAGDLAGAIQTGGGDARTIDPDRVLVKRIDVRAVTVFLNDLFDMKFFAVGRAQNMDLGGGVVAGDVDFGIQPLPDDGKGIAKPGGAYYGRIRRHSGKCGFVRPAVHLETAARIKVAGVDDAVIGDPHLVEVVCAAGDTGHVELADAVAGGRIQGHDAMGNRPGCHQQVVGHLVQGDAPRHVIVLDKSLRGVIGADFPDGCSCTVHQCKSRAGEEQ